MINSQSKEKLVNEIPIRNESESYPEGFNLKPGLKPYLVFNHFFIPTQHLFGPHTLCLTFVNVTYQMTYPIS